MELARNCPKCRKLITYQYSNSFEYAVMKNSCCKSCASLIRMQQAGARERISLAVSGDKNPMAGKTMQDVWREKYGKEASIERTVRHHKNTSSNNARAMRGVSVYDMWLQRYGKEEADRKDTVRRIQWSKAMSGSKNHRFGKPAPRRSGGGWGGWYHGFYFRSLLELSYILHLARCGTTWESGEQAKFAVAYEFEGRHRNYFPDFFLNGKTHVEVKPSSLVGLKQNQAKFVAARQQLLDFCIVTEKDFDIVNKAQLRQLCAAGEVELLNRWKSKLFS